METKICFNLTRLGESHVKSGKPCQDYSLSWQSDDGVAVAIVCDGHGGSTYVRSDIGSKLAAEIALKNIQSFIKSPEFSLLIGIKGAVTASPKSIRDVLLQTENVKKQNLSESQKEQLDQDLRYYTSVKALPEQEKMFRRLFGAIYVQWIDAITAYTNENPFNDEELNALGGKKLVKAYGSTLMAFVVTSSCWFAFHIGDGKIEVCNANMEWSEPVPWDCNCFLNMTTSLCNTDPVPMFRYAFNGLGDFPTAVFLGSDGIDDTWGSTENLQNFYAETMMIMDDIGVEKAIEELGDYLPVMSKKGSQDDMSIAGIIDKDSLSGAVDVFKVRKRLKSLFLERNQREKELLELKKNISEKEADNAVLVKGIEKTAEELKEFIKLITKKKTEKEFQLSVKRDEYNKRESDLNDLKKDYADKTVAFNQWKEENRGEVESLKLRIAELKEKNDNLQQKNTSESAYSIGGIITDEIPLTTSLDSPTIAIETVGFEIEEPTEDKERESTSI